MLCRCNGVGAIGLFPMVAHHSINNNQEGCATMSRRVIVYSSQNYVKQYIAPIFDKAFPGSTYVEV